MDGIKYRLCKIDKEEELEQFVKNHYKDIFGEDSLYFDLKQKLISKAGVGSIPDGYVIKFSGQPKWYVVEVELSSHPLYDHIVTQLSRFIHGVSTDVTRRELVEAFYDETTSDIVTKASVEKQIGSPEIYRFLSKLISNSPILAILINEKTRILEEACNSLPLVDKQIVEFQIFERMDVGIRNAYLFEPLYEIKGIEREVPKRGTSKEQIEEIPRIRPLVLSITKSELKTLREGIVLIAPSKPDGVDFLIEYNAWGFIRIKRKPDYFALYVSSPESKISYFGEVEDIVIPGASNSPISKEEARKYETFKEGKKVVVLKPNSLKKLEKGIPMGVRRGKLQGIKFVTLTQFINAETIDDF